MFENGWFRRGILSAHTDYIIYVVAFFPPDRGPFCSVCHKNIFFFTLFYSFMDTIRFGCHKYSIQNVSRTFSTNLHVIHILVPQKVFCKWCFNIHTTRCTCVHAKRCLYLPTKEPLVWFCSNFGQKSLEKTVSGILCIVWIPCLWWIWSTPGDQLLSGYQGVLVSCYSCILTQ